MTLDSNMWIGIVVVVALVVAAIAVWKGRAFWVNVLGIKFGTPQEEPTQIKVGNKIKGTDVKAGNFVGTTSNTSKTNIDVANQAKFKRAELGHFIGAGSTPATDTEERLPGSQGSAPPKP